MDVVCLGLALKLVGFHYVPSDGSNPVIVEGLLHCGVLCGLDEKCASIVFNTETKECIQRRRWATKVDARHYPVNSAVIMFNTPRQSPCPTEQGYSMNTELMICYKVHGRSTTKSDATRSCIREGADRLMRIESFPKRQFFTHELQHYGVPYVDGEMTNGKWIHADGTPMTYLPFLPNEPSGDGSCLEFKEALNDISCHCHKIYVCEKLV